MRPRAVEAAGRGAAGQVREKTAERFSPHFCISAAQAPACYGGQRWPTAALLFEYLEHSHSASAPEGELLGIACGDVRARDGMCSTYSGEGEEQPLAVS